MLMTRCKAEKEREKQEQTARRDRREVERDGSVIGSQMKKAKHIEELQRKKS